MIQKIKILILSHKIISIVVLVVVVVGAYFMFFRSSASGETRYVTENVSKGDIVVAVTGTGQLEAYNTITLKSKNSGDITYVGVKVGQEVKKGALIASVDSRDAKIDLENAQISLDKLLAGPDSLSLLKEQNSLTKSYNDGWNTVSSFIADTKSILDEVNGIYDNDGYLSYSKIASLSSTGKNKITLAQSNYYKANKNLKDITKLYESLSRSSSKEDIKNLIDRTYELARTIASTVKDTESAYDYTVNYFDDQNDTKALSAKTDIDSWLTDSNNYVTNLLSAVNDIEENTQSLKDTQTGSDSDQLNIRSARLSLLSKQNAYNDCFTYAPFDGTIATLTAKVGESSGSSIGTLITKQKLANISLNEVDIAKIKLGQKATLTFDAIDDLVMDGTVVEIDPIGTVSQGVVSYNIKIGLDNNDDRVKPGMSVSASIITDTAKDVVIVPSSSIKTKNGGNYVEIFNSPLTKSSTGIYGSVSSILPRRVEVTVGLVGDNSTEIISGLKEGDIVVTKTITSNASSTKTNTQAPSIINAVGGNRAGGGGAVIR